MLPVVETLRRWLVVSCATALAATVAPVGARAVTATWVGGTGNWSNPAQWSTNPLYPCNGNGGQNYDAAIASGNATLDLDCEIDALTLSGATVGGAFTLTLHGLFSWSAGPLAGSGTTRALAGAALTGTGTKSFTGSRGLDLVSGAATWSDGSINLGGGGATLRNQTALTVSGPNGRSMLDGGSGSFVNEGVLTFALASGASVLTLSPASVTLENVVHVNNGILAVNADGSHSASFDGAGTLRFSGGTQSLAAGANVSVATLEVRGGALTLDSGASISGGDLLLQVGTLTLAGLGATTTVASLTQNSGTLDGAGTLETTGPLTWNAGTMGGSGTTRALSGAALSSSGTKILGGTRKLDLAGGSSNWSSGAISLGSGGATLRNQTGSALAITGGNGRALSDTSAGSFVNEGSLSVNLDAAASVVTISPANITLGNAVHVNTGVLALNGNGAHTASFDGAGTLRIAGGTQALAAGSSTGVAVLDVRGGTLTADAGASVAVGNLHIQIGTFSIADAGTSVAATAVTQDSGTLSGDGALEATGPLVWNAGTMGGAATTRALGGAALAGSGTKLFADTRTLELGGGASSWSDGSISLGAGSARLRVLPSGSLTATGTNGRTLSDQANLGTFENQGTFTLDLDAPGSLLNFTPGATQNSGTLDLVSGTLQLQGSFTQTAGVTRLSGGSLESLTTTYQFQGGTLEGSGTVQGDAVCACVLSPGLSAGTLMLTGDLTLQPGAELRAELGGLAQGTQYDFVPVSGTAALAGTFSASFLSGFEQSVSPANTFTVLSAASPLSGVFGNVASGERVITTPGFDSIAVSYGAGSPFGASHVVLHDFRAFAPVATLDVVGTAQGGSLTLVIAGVEIAVTTTPGQTGAQVAAALEDAIRASNALARMGFTAIASGSSIQINHGADAISVDDPGLSVNEVANVPALPGAALALGAGLLAAVARRTLRTR